MSVLGVHEITPPHFALVGGATEITDTGQAEPLPSVDVLTLQMCGLIERYPDTAASLKLLMHCFGDDLPLQTSDTDAVDTHSLVVDLLLNGPLCEDSEALATVGGYMYVKRRQQLEDVYGQITRHIPLPDLFSALSILEAPMNPDPIDKPDKYALLSQQASLLQRTIDRHGLEGAGDISPGREHAAWHEFTRAARHLEDDPPTTTEVGGSHDNHDFLAKQLTAIAAMRTPITGLVNAIGNLTGQHSETGEEVAIPAPFTLRSVTVLEINNTDQSENDLATGYELAVTLRGSDGEAAVMPLAMLCEAHAAHREYLDDKTLFTVALVDALINCTDAEEFKAQFAAACVNLARGESVALHIDADETTLNQLFSESDALSSLTRLSGEADDCDGLEQWPVRSSLEGEPDRMHVSNVDKRTFETRGTVDSQSERPVHGRMVCFDPGLLIEVNSEQPCDSYDLELRLELPYAAVDESDNDYYICPQIPGFRVVGYRPAGGAADQYALRYVATAEDPYKLIEVSVPLERVERLSQRLDSIGLSDAADRLRQAECQTLDAVWAILEQNLIYGNGRRRITLEAQEFEDLEFFEEDGCLVGVCSLFAALAAFSIRELLPGSEPRVIGGHKLNPWTISADGHAQTVFTVNGRQQITDLHARGQRDAQARSDSEANGQSHIIAATPVEAFGVTAKNMFTRLHGALLSKYRMPDEASLVRCLVKLPETNFARQLYGLVTQAKSITANASYEEISPLLQQRAHLADLVRHWQNTTVDARRHLASALGVWSDQEADFFSDILKQLEQSLRMV